MIEQREFFSVPDVMKATDLGRTTVYGEIRAGRLRVTKVGGRTLVHRADFEEWVQALRGVS